MLGPHIAYKATLPACVLINFFPHKPALATKGSSTTKNSNNQPGPMYIETCRISHMSRETLAGQDRNLQTVSMTTPCHPWCQPNCLPSTGSARVCPRLHSHRSRKHRRATRRQLCLSNKVHHWATERTNLSHWSARP